MDIKTIKKEIFSISSLQQFNELSLKIFHFQYNSCQIYKDYVDSLGIYIHKITNYHQIPFLPIRFFKTHKVYSYHKPEQKIFYSSTTTGQVPSKHYVADLSIYEESFTRCFQYFYNNINEYSILALLPSYLERDGSSLIYMVNEFLQHNQHPLSNFYKEISNEVYQKILHADLNGQKMLLIGVTYALCDLIEEKRTYYGKNLTIMETGGMKGKRREMIKQELHEKLRTGFNVQNIHSEYGMTELLSQAYSKGNGVFQTPPWMKVITREINDPLAIMSGKTGVINVIDLANIYSCAFIATDDLGIVHSDESFEVLGRLDFSDMRGCNLMLS